jgi:hypothetical protein
MQDGMYYLNCGRMAMVKSKSECHENTRIYWHRQITALKNNYIECPNPSDTIRCDACPEANMSKEKVN